MIYDVGEKRKKMDRYARRLDNAKRNVDGRPPLSLIEKQEREAKRHRVSIGASEPKPEPVTALDWPID